MPVGRERGLKEGSREVPRIAVDAHRFVRQLKKQMRWILSDSATVLSNFVEPGVEHWFEH